jgi:two-component system, cell cycle response regulator DivK
MDFGRPIFNWSQFTILIVEDDVSSTFYLKEVLKDTGAYLLHAPDGQAAIEACKTKQPIHVILMDIKMPVMNGYDATKVIKELFPDIPVIAQTANAGYETRLLCKEAGCDDFISKPIDSAELLDKISSYLPR